MPSSSQTHLHYLIPLHEVLEAFENVGQVSPNEIGLIALGQVALERFDHGIYCLIKKGLVYRITGFCDKTFKNGLHVHAKGNWGVGLSVMLKNWREEILDIVKKNFHSPALDQVCKVSCCDFQYTNKWSTLEYVQYLKDQRTQLTNPQSRQTEWLYRGNVHRNGSAHQSLRVLKILWRLLWHFSFTWAWGS